MLGRTLFIGAGAMGGAILRGALRAGVLQKENLLVTVRTATHAEALSKEFSLPVSTELPDFKTQDIQTIVLAVKPQVLASVMKNLSHVSQGTLMISLAAGITLASLETYLPYCKWYRAMPNMPASIGYGMTALTAGCHSDEETTAAVVDLFASVGEVALVSEADLDRLGALSGAGPGYVYVMLDALADAGVRIGLPRPLAIKAAAQTLYGAGAMALKTGQHPAVLRDQVTSPGGTTIAGIAAMEKGGLRSALQDGVLACYERSNELGKKS